MISLAEALISDDTQMTLFTAAGLLRAEAHAAFPTAAQYIRGIYEEYLNWLCTQDETFALPQGVARSPLLQERELFSRRAPGGTCLSALASGKCGSFTEKLNRSKGCGGVMRVAPVAVHFAHEGRHARRCRISCGTGGGDHAQPPARIYPCGLSCRTPSFPPARRAVAHGRGSGMAGFVCGL